MERALSELRERPINTMDPILLELNEEYETIKRKIASCEEELEMDHEKLEKVLKQIEEIEETKENKRKRKRDLNNLEDEKIEIESDIKNTNEFLEYLHTKKKELETQLSDSIVKNAMDPTVSRSPLARLSAHGPHFRGNFQRLISQFKGPGGTRKSRKTRKTRKTRKA